jgi:curved DNA-binding protein CbpA
VPASSPERAARTRRFQLVNDAYYTLSDPARRRDYDAARRFHTASGGGSNDDPDEETPQGGEMPGGFDWGAADAQFGGAFEEMLREEGMAEGGDARPTGLFWGVVGGVSGAALGFIVANLPGAVAGAVAGNRLGAVRDAKGKSVYEVFQELPQEDKAKLLADLAARMFSHAVGS